MLTRALKGLAVLIALFLFLFSGVILHLILNLFKPSLRWRVFSRLIRIFALTLRKILSVRVILDGNPDSVKGGGVLIISNHLSYLDGIVLGSIFPVIYLSKKDIKSWALVGWMSSLSGTIFIDRKRKDLSPEYIREIVEKIKNQANILLFAEGTSTNGEVILPFQTVFFAAPLEARCEILPITIYYTKINDENLTTLNRDKIHWYGRIPFSKHFMQLMELKNIEVTVKIHQKIDTRGFENDNFGRKKLAEFVRGIVLQGYPYIGKG